MVSRFTFTLGHDPEWDAPCVNKVPHASGGFVRYSDYEALRTELEQVRRERDDYRAAYKRELDGRIAAERLTGARVVTEAMVEAGAKAIVACRFEDESEPVSDYDLELSRAAIEAALAEPAGKEKALRELIDSYRARFTDEKADYQRGILDTLDNIEMVLDGTHDEGPPLAEPAGEVEPRQFLPTEDGEFNGNTTEVPIAAEDGREVDWVDVTGWGAFKGHAIPVDAARYIAEKINLYAEHRTAPPGASAIREALEAIRALSGLDGELCKASATIMSRMADIHQTADAALAGAKP